MLLKYAQVSQEATKLNGIETLVAIVALVKLAYPPINFETEGSCSKAKRQSKII